MSATRKPGAGFVVRHRGRKIGAVIVSAGAPGAFAAWGPDGKIGDTFETAGAASNAIRKAHSARKRGEKLT